MSQAPVGPDGPISAGVAVNTEAAPRPPLSKAPVTSAVLPSEERAAPMPK